MSVVRPSSPIGDVIFCDDIREEAGGKFTYVGVYPSGNLVLHAPTPVSLAKLCMVVSYFERPADDAGPVTVKVFFPGDPDDKPAMAIELPIEELRKIPLPTDPDAEDPMYGARANLIFSPLRLSQLGRIKVRAFRGTDEFPLGSLLITSSLTASVSEPPSEQSPPDVPAS